MPPGEDPELGQPKNNPPNRKQRRAAMFENRPPQNEPKIVPPAASPDPPKIPIFISKVRSTLAAASARLGSINEAIARKFNTNREIVFRFEVGGLSALGFTLMQIGEWAAAVACWVLVGAVLFIKALAWKGISERKRLTVFLRAISSVGALGLSVLLIMVTTLRKPETEPWTNLQKLHKAAAIAENQPANTQPVDNVAVYLECQWGQYPIKIPPGATIHVMRLHPALLKGSPSFGAIGVFHDVIATNEAVTWPSKPDGAWPSRAESMESLKKGVTQAPFMFKCDLSSFGKSAVEDISIPMLVRPNQAGAKGRVYQVVFDPLLTGSHFPFYVVNYCQEQIYVTWPDSLRVHVLGEDAYRTVPLKMIKRDWPGNLMIFMPAGFKWNTGTQGCNWGWE